MIGISAQVSLYPLEQSQMTAGVDAALRVFRERGLSVVPGSMSTVISGDDEAVFAALRTAFGEVAAQAPVVMVVTFSNACPVPAREA